LSTKLADTLVTSRPCFEAAAAAPNVERLDLRDHTDGVCPTTQPACRLSSTRLAPDPPRDATLRCAIVGDSDHGSSEDPSCLDLSRVASSYACERCRGIF